MEREFKVKIIGKWIKGNWWKRPQLSVEFIEEVSPKYVDISVIMAAWYAFTIGDLISITLKYNEKNGKWYYKR